MNPPKTPYKQAHGRDICPSKVLYKQATSNGIKSGTRERNNELLPLVIAGDENARKEMIESNIALVIVRVDAFIQQFPCAAYLRQDLVSEGLLALCEAVKTMATNAIDQGKNVNATGYLNLSISRAVGHRVDTEMHMNLPASTARLARDNGRSIPSQVPLSSVDRLNPNLGSISYDETKLRELRDLIESCAETPIERTILKMREEGYVDAEIAEAIGIPRSTTCVLRLQMYERLREKMKDDS